MATPRTVAFYTLGCKLNFSETSSIATQFKDAGYTEVDFEDISDVYIVNTCAVTHMAESKGRNIIRRAHKTNPDAKIIVIGCYAQIKPKEIVDIEGVDLVLGAAEKFNILDYIDTIAQVPGKGMVMAGEVTEANKFINAFSFGDRTRSFLKVQDGCSYNCSFCTIPLARGKSRSDTIENVVKNAEEIGKRGVKEIVLTGVNIGDFGNGPELIDGEKVHKDVKFIDLIRELDKVESVSRFRISSIEPNLCNDEIIEFVANSKRFVPHFHMPLQSGSNRLLGLMRRRYRRELYEERVHKIKSLMPHASIGVDVIVGFPDEQDEDFRETYEFLRNMDISYIHAFTFSERNDTIAAEMDNQIPMHIRRERTIRLRGLSAKKTRAFYKKYLGTEHEVLVEQSKGDELHGYTANYIRVELPENAGEVNDLIKIKLENFTEDGTVAAIPISSKTHAAV